MHFICARAFWAYFSLALPAPDKHGALGLYRHHRLVNSDPLVAAVPGLDNHPVRNYVSCCSRNTSILGWVKLELLESP